MDTQDTFGSWNERKERLKQKFADLTNNDFTSESEKTEELLDKLGVKIGKTKDELRQIIKPQ